MSAFTKCFRPVSNYPSDFSDLVVWLKADSGATFDIPTKRVSAWTDQSGNGNSVAQATAGKQPLRYGYYGANDKTYLSFDGTNDSFTSDSNSPITSNSYTIFVVSKQNVAAAGPFPIFSYRRSASQEILIGFKDNLFYSYVKNGTAELFLNSGHSNNYGLIATSLDGGAGKLKTSIDGGSDSISSTTWADTTTWNAVAFEVGGKTGSFANANVEEIIVYNRVLTDVERSDVKNYLNTKYKIY